MYMNLWNNTLQRDSVDVKDKKMNLFPKMVDRGKKSTTGRRKHMFPAKKSKVQNVRCCVER